MSAEFALNNPVELILTTLKEEPYLKNPSTE